MGNARDRIFPQAPLHVKVAVESALLEDYMNECMAY